MSADTLYKSLGDWKKTVDVLFEWKKDNPYYKACINKELKKAKELIEKGYFAENTYLWIEPFLTSIPSCECGMGCTRNRNYPVSLILNADISFISRLSDYGLLPEKLIDYGLFYEI